jgi:hypothetical protein
MTKGTRGSKDPRPRSGYAREDQRHTVRVRVSKEQAEVLAERWGVTIEDAVRRAVREAAMSNIRHCDWVTDGERAGVVVHNEVFWIGGDVSPVSDALTVMSREDADRALAAAGQSSEDT